MKKLLSILLCLFCVWTASGQDLVSEIRTIVGNRQAEVGVAVLCGDSVVTVGNERQYPLMSVFKLHVAVAALRKMEKENVLLDSALVVRPGQLREDTYSPLRDRFPGQTVRISLRDLLGYTVTLSDNNTCDILIDFAGGVGRVDSCMRSLGLSDFSLTETEADMHADLQACYRNRSTPLEVARLLRKIYTEEILCPEHFSALEQAMLGCSTGTDKLRAGLPSDIPLAHKTGHSDRLPNGCLIGTADAGVIYLPDGRKCYIAVLIKDSQEPDDINAGMIARIAAAAYAAFAR